jgi:hypothetical protein
VPVFRPASTVVAGGPETDALPTWDMTVLYPGLDAPEFAEAFAALLDRIAALVRVFDEEGSGRVRRRADGRGVVTRFERVLRVERNPRRLRNDERLPLRLRHHRLPRRRGPGAE